MRAPTVLVALAAFMLSPAHADECMDGAEDQAAMTACAARSYQAADAGLNRVFHEIRARLGDDADTRNLLRRSEQAWVAFRDAECDFAASATAGGSAYSMTRDLCLADLTAARSTRLQQYLDCEEGDLSCPVPPGE